MLLCNSLYSIFICILPNLPETLDFRSRTSRYLLFLVEEMTNLYFSCTGLIYIDMRRSHIRTVGCLQDNGVLVWCLEGLPPCRDVFITLFRNTLKK